MKLSRAFLIFFCAIPAAYSATVTNITFDNASDLANNFRQTQAAGTANGLVTGGYVDIAAAGSPTAYVAVYDTTPGNAADPAVTFDGAFTVTLSVSAAEANSSFGIYLYESGTSNNLLMIFNLDSSIVSAGNELIRFWRDAANVGAGDVGTIYGAGAVTGTNGAFDATSSGYHTNATVRGDATVDTTSPYTFYNLTLDYDPTGRTMKATVGNFSSTLAIPVGDVIVNPSIALRINDTSTGAGSAKFDNFSVIPEPSSSLLLLGGAGMLAIRRRRA